MFRTDNNSLLDKSQFNSPMREKEVKNDHLARTMASNGDNDLFHQEQRRNEREKIRKKLAAMDSDNEDICISYEGNTKKMADGVNLQICFVNDTCDKETETTKVFRNSQNLKQYSAMSRYGIPIDTHNFSSLSGCRAAQSFPYWQRPSVLFNRRLKLLKSQIDNKKDRKTLMKEDIFLYHSRLQSEVRIALSQAKDMARMQILVERQQRKLSPLSSLVGFTFPEGWCKLDGEILNNMNLAQIQVIVNDLHSQIENLNEELVRLLLERDDLHMEQDSMLVDIEDLTQHLGLKGTREK